MVTIEDVRTLALDLPRTTEALVRGRVKFRVGSIVYASFSHDETVMVDAPEMHELVFDAWRMVVPKRVAAEYELGLQAS